VTEEPRARDQKVVDEFRTNGGARSGACTRSRDQLPPVLDEFLIDLYASRRANVA